jgi:hypothetical protein
LLFSWEQRVIFLIGIDDSGQPGKAGTDSLALGLGLHLQARGFATLMHISRHQLLPTDEFPGASVNQAYCLALSGDPNAQREIDMESRVYIMRNASAGSNAGLTLARSDRVNQRILSFAQACRSLVLQRQDALDLARASGLTTVGFTGSGSGVIGSLAAVGWRWQGSDGTITWMPGLDKLKGAMPFHQVLHHCSFDYVQSTRGHTPLFDEIIQLGAGPTPLLKENRTLLLLEAAPRGAEWHWVAAKSR